MTKRLKVALACIMVVLTLLATLASASATTEKHPEVLLDALAFIEARAEEGCPKWTIKFTEKDVLPTLARFNLSPEEKRAVYLSLVNLYWVCERYTKATDALRKAFSLIPTAETVRLALQALPPEILSDVSLRIAEKLRTKNPALAGRLYRALIDVLPDYPNVYKALLPFVIEDKKAQRAFWGG